VTPIDDPAPTDGPGRVAGLVLGAGFAVASRGPCDQSRPRIVASPHAERADHAPVAGPREGELRDISRKV